jgi:hypothetical protein
MKTIRNNDGSISFIKTRDDIEKEKNLNTIKDLKNKIEELEKRIEILENSSILNSNVSEEKIEASSVGDKNV